MALDLLKQDKATKVGIKAKRLKAAWGLAVAPQLEAVEVLSSLSGIAQARLHSDRAHVIAANDWSPESLASKLIDRGIAVSGVEPVEPTLEDVFTLLAHHVS